MISTLYSDARTLVLRNKYASVNVQNTDDNMRKLTYLGHSAFFIEKDGDGILIDPFITGNPLADFDFKEKRITHIVVTHAHHDHLGDAIEISKHSGAPIIAVFELANYCMQKGAKAIPVNIGAKLKFNWGSVKFLPAVHSSSNPDLPYGGTAASLLFDIDGTTIYHAGDTSLMPDFSMIGELYNPHYALLPIGGFYTMDMQDAAIAAKMLYAKKVIPMHYNTFPGIKVDVQKFVDSLEAQGQKCLPLKANEYVKI
jgi:L-ascorbate metabolism protein UlaG (beta-lactamase superfamily)